MRCATLEMAARLLEENEISGMPVVDRDGVLVGVLAETDIVRARAVAATCGTAGRACTCAT